MKTADFRVQLFDLISVFFLLVFQKYFSTKHALFKVCKVRDCFCQNMEIPFSREIRCIVAVKAIDIQRTYSRNLNAISGKERRHH